LDKFAVVKKYIDEFDYYSLLKHGAPADEFDSYSCEFAEQIQENDTVEEIAYIISNRVDRAFGEKVCPDKFLETAGRIKLAMENISENEEKGN